MYWNATTWTMRLEHKRYVCTQGGIQTFFLEDFFMFNSRCCVFLSFLNVYDISSSLLSNLHPLSILRHITVKPVSNGPLHMARRLPRMTPFIYLFSMILVDSMGSVQTSIDFRRATDSFKTYAKGYDTLLDSNATFPFRWHILKPSSPKYVNPTKSQKTWQQQTDSKTPIHSHCSKQNDEPLLHKAMHQYLKEN